MWAQRAPWSGTAGFCLVLLLSWDSFSFYARRSEPPNRRWVWAGSHFLVCSLRFCPTGAEHRRDSVSICWRAGPSESGVPDGGWVPDPERSCASRGAWTPTGAGVQWPPAGGAPSFAFSWEAVKEASWKQLPSQINEHFQT